MARSATAEEKSDSAEAARAAAAAAAAAEGDAESEIEVFIFFATSEHGILMQGTLIYINKPLLPTISWDCRLVSSKTTEWSNGWSLGPSSLLPQRSGFQAPVGRGQ